MDNLEKDTINNFIDFPDLLKTKTSKNKIQIKYFK